MGGGAGKLCGMLSHELLGTDCYDCKSQQGTGVFYRVAHLAGGVLVLHRGFPFVCAICAPRLHPHRSALLCKATTAAYSGCMEIHEWHAHTPPALQAAAAAAKTNAALFKMGMIWNGCSSSSPLFHVKDTKRQTHAGFASFLAKSIWAAAKASSL